MDDDIDVMIDTMYGPRTLKDIAAWPTHVCEDCGTEHAHPAGLVAPYWPRCWDCWRICVDPAPSAGTK